MGKSITDLKAQAYNFVQIKSRNISRSYSHEPHNVCGYYRYSFYMYSYLFIFQIKIFSFYLNLSFSKLPIIRSRCYSYNQDCRNNMLNVYMCTIRFVVPHNVTHCKRNSYLQSLQVKTSPRIDVSILISILGQRFDAFAMN